MDIDEDGTIICPTTGTYCVRAFCEDYGCANSLGVPEDVHDHACGTIPLDEIAPLIGPLKRPRSKKSPQGDMFKS